MLNVEYCYSVLITNASLLFSIFFYIFSSVFYMHNQSHYTCTFLSQTPTTFDRSTAHSSKIKTHFAILISHFTFLLFMLNVEYCYSVLITNASLLFIFFLFFFSIFFSSVFYMHNQSHYTCTFLSQTPTTLDRSTFKQGKQSEGKTREIIWG